MKKIKFFAAMLAAAMLLGGVFGSVNAFAEPPKNGIIVQVDGRWYSFDDEGDFEAIAKKVTLITNDEVEGYVTTSFQEEERFVKAYQRLIEPKEVDLRNLSAVRGQYAPVPNDMDRGDPAAWRKAYDYSEVRDDGTLVHRTLPKAVTSSTYATVGEDGVMVYSTPIVVVHDCPPTIPPVSSTGN